MPAPLLGAALAGVASAGMGMIANKIDRDAQIDQQWKLNYDQMVLQQQLGKYNQQLAMKTWNDTNYEAQLEHMRNAGLNPALMYKSAGEGGQTLGNQASSAVAGAQAPHGGTTGMALQLGLQAAMQAAQIRNLDANTEKTKVDTAKTAGVDTQQAQANIAQTQTATEKLKTEVKNTEIQTSILKAQEEIAKIQANIANVTQTDAIDQIKIINDKLYGEAQSAITKGNVDKNTREEVTKLIKQSTIEQQLRIATQKQGLQMNEAQMTKIAAEIQNMTTQQMQNWLKLDQNNREIELKKIMTEFETSTPQQIKQWTSLIGDILKTAATGAMAAGL